MKFFLLLTTICQLSFGAFGIGVTNLPSNGGDLITRDFSSSPVTSSYNGANATLASGLSGKGNFCAINGATTAMLLATTDSACSASINAQFVVLPNNGAVCLDRYSIKSNVCIKTASGTIASGTLYAWPW